MIRSAKSASNFEPLCVLRLFAAKYYRILCALWGFEKSGLTEKTPHNIVKRYVEKEPSYKHQADISNNPLRPLTQR